MDLQVVLAQLVLLNLFHTNRQWRMSLRLVLIKALSLFNTKRAMLRPRLLIMSLARLKIAIATPRLARGPSGITDQLLLAVAVKWAIMGLHQIIPPPPPLVMHLSYLAVVPLALALHMADSLEAGFNNNRLFRMGEILAGL